jgi:hypothetical protein
MFSCLPQIRKVARDANGASAISYSTWTLRTGANIATALYALTKSGDMYLAFVSIVDAGCCVTVIVLTILKRRGVASRTVAQPACHAIPNGLLTMQPSSFSPLPILPTGHGAPGRRGLSFAARASERLAL